MIRQIEVARRGRSENAIPESLFTKSVTEEVLRRIRVIEETLEDEDEDE